MSLTITTREATVHIPDRVYKSLAAFRAWAGDNELPEKTRIDFYKGEVWVDMGWEQVFTHCSLKATILSALGTLTHDTDMGYYWTSGILVTNEAADLSGNPDGTFVSHEALEAGRMTLAPAADDEGTTELVGTADMVLEVVSASSVTKDTVALRQAYWEAGIPEYWLADARGDRLDFRILKHGPKGYAEVRRQAGWLKSAAFGKAFRLARGADRAGNPRFRLDVK